ncbi:MAG: ABC transporter ATP-binding protein [Pseudomonadota bacterium]
MTASASICKLKPWEDPGAKPYLSVSGIVKRFAGVAAVDGVSLDIHGGEFFALLGPSGCGKTTLLRMLAGFETPDEGQILLDGEDLTAIPPHERPVNMMFQSYALFPHMSVEKNIAFGLEMEGMARPQIRSRVEEMLALVRLEKLARRKPDQLSGGQRQRVALARALAKKPKLILLDEPLGALDRKLREATQFELVNIQESLGLTFVIVTHDQEEAMTVSTRLAVMDEGRIAQIGEPHVVYEAPETRYVAEFIGDVNIFEGQVEQAGRVSLSGGGAAELAEERLPAVGRSTCLALRPEKIAIEQAGQAETSAPNTLLGTVDEIGYLGDKSIYHVRLDGGGLVRVARTNRIRSLDEAIEWESRVRLSWDAKSIVVLKA